MERSLSTAQGQPFFQVVAAGAVAILILAALLPPASIQAASGYLDWGVKESFRSYVTGPIAHGAISVSGGATRNSDGTFRFPAAPGGSAIAASFTGAVRFTGHDGELDLTIANLRIQLSETTGTLFADITDRSSAAGGQVQTHTNLAFASLNLAGVTPVDTGGGLSWANVPTSLTVAGATVFGGFYQAGQALDPVSFTLALSGGGNGGGGSRPALGAGDKDSGTPVPNATAITVTPTPLVTGFLQWGVKKELRDYVTGPIGNGRITPGAGAIQLPDGSYQFPAATGSSFMGASVTTISFAGSVHFVADNGQLDVTLANLRVQLNGAQGTLIADVTSRSQSSSQAVTHSQVALATLSLSAVAPVFSGGNVSWTDVPVFLTASGAHRFADRFQAGQALDPLTLTIPNSLIAGTKTPTPNLTTSPTPAAVTGTYLQWGVKKAFRDYITGSIARGSITLSGGATQNGDGTIRFPANGLAASSLASYAGSVRFVGHDGQLELTISNLRVQLAGGTGTLIADLASKPLGSKQLVSYTNVALVTLNLGAVSPVESGGVTTWFSVPTILTATAAPRFGDLYTAGMAFDPLTFVHEVGVQRAATPTATAMLTPAAAPATGLVWKLADPVAATGAVAVPHTVAAPAIRDANGVVFPVGQVAYNPSTGLMAVDFQGSLTLGAASQTSPRVMLANPSIVVDEQRVGKLWADVSYCILMCATQPVWIGPARGELVTIHAERSAIADTAGVVSWTFTPNYPQPGDPMHPAFGQIPRSILDAMVRTLQGAPVTVGFDYRGGLSTSPGAAPSRGATMGNQALAGGAGSGAPASGSSTVRGGGQLRLQTPTTARVATGMTWKVSELVWTGSELAAAREATAVPTQDPERGFVFPVEKVSYEPTTGVTAVDFVGSLILTGSAEPGQVRISNPSIVIDERGAGALLASVSHCTGVAACGDSWVGPFRVTIATFQVDPAAVSDTGNRVSWTVTPSYPLQADPNHPTFGQFPQPFLNSLAPSLQAHFKDTTDAHGAPSVNNSLKPPAPITVSFDYTATASAPRDGAAGSGAAGSLNWGVRESFRNYVQGPIARGNVVVSGGATQNRDGTFQFPAAAGASRSSASFTGTVRFTGHDGQLDMTIANPRIQLSGTIGTLFVDVVNKSESAGEAGDQRNVEFATLDLSRVRPVEAAGSVSWSNVPAALTEAGSRAFGGNYRAGQALDPVTFTLRTTTSRGEGSNP